MTYKKVQLFSGGAPLAMSWASRIGGALAAYALHPFGHERHDPTRYYPKAEAEQ